MAVAAQCACRWRASTSSPTRPGARHDHDRPSSPRTCSRCRAPSPPTAETGSPPDPEALVGQQWLGSDLSMPAPRSPAAWQTFRKTFVQATRSTATSGAGTSSSEQRTRGPQVPPGGRHREGFAHYRLRFGDDIAWPKGVRCAATSTTRSPEPSRRTSPTPIVSVNGDANDLLLGWEVVKPDGGCFGPASLLGDPARRSPRPWPPRSNCAAAGHWRLSHSGAVQGSGSRRGPRAPG